MDTPDSIEHDSPLTIPYLREAVLAMRESRLEDKGFQSDIDCFDRGLAAANTCQGLERVYLMGSIHERFLGHAQHWRDGWMELIEVEAWQVPEHEIVDFEPSHSMAAMVRGLIFNRHVAGGDPERAMKTVELFPSHVTDFDLIEMDNKGNASFVGGGVADAEKVAAVVERHLPDLILFRQARDYLTVYKAFGKAAEGATERIWERLDEMAEDFPFRETVACDFVLSLARRGEFEDSIEVMSMFLTDTRTRSQATDVIARQAYRSGRLDVIHLIGQELAGDTVLQADFYLRQAIVRREELKRAEPISTADLPESSAADDEAGTPSAKLSD